ncbi:hypothetical protein AXG93_1467s1240 [Marchantia polymorpha subsp. ruderalis]|uniref:Reticulon domain-containing protein n=1 Tax=Marchantia polymorpha subsp. ruderalis TaxID=1480154 RepID=A0A176WMK4_MARPO|nr:hypothetical protein AXG93_1467s1240 [Marchantia polymorpha subsp. ruderalis]
MSEGFESGAGQTRIAELLLSAGLCPALHAKIGFRPRSNHLERAPTSSRVPQMLRKSPLSFGTPRAGSYKGSLDRSEGLGRFSEAGLVVPVVWIVSIPVDPLEWQVTPEVANDVAACVANTVGAAEGVLRVAASGRDSKLFTKVVLVLYLISAIGRSASGATVAYFALCFAMIVPYCVSKIAPEITAHTPTFLQKRFNSLTGSLTPGNSPMSNYNSPRHF